MRKKTKQSVDVANVESAWQKFFDQHKTYDEDKLIRDGWLDIFEIARRMNISRNGASSRMKKMNLENKQFSVLREGKVRQISFYRLK